MRRAHSETHQVLARFDRGARPATKRRRTECRGTQSEMGADARGPAQSYRNTRRCVHCGAVDYCAARRHEGGSVSCAAFWAFARAVAHTDSAEEFERHWRLLIRSTGQCKLPKRNRPPAPRVVWLKRHNFPHRRFRNDRSQNYMALGETACRAKPAQNVETPAPGKIRCRTGPSI